MIDAFLDLQAEFRAIAGRFHDSDEPMLKKAQQRDQAIGERP
jgi:hypothetical protein